MLKQRILTGIILAVVVVTAALAEDVFWISLLLSAGLLFAAAELFKLMLKIPRWLILVLACGFALLFWLSINVLNSVVVQVQTLVGAGVWMVIALSLRFYRHHGQWSLLVRVLLLGLVLDLLWICVHGLLYLHQVHGGPMLLFLLSLVAVADIGAYFSGRRFGRHKLAPAISPSKTWEGVVGGLLASLVWIGIVCGLSEPMTEEGFPMPLIWVFAAGVMTAAMSIVGDLLESVIKREAGVKDSGTLLPGHGGVLDRIDGVIAASPVFVSGLYLATLW